MAQNSRAVRSINILLVIFGSIFHLSATTPVLEWDPSSDASIAGYKFYRGEKSRAYDQVIDIGMQTSIPLTNLDAGLTYYVAITAYNTNFVESPFSDELSYTPPVDGVTTFAQRCLLRVTNNTALVSFYGKSGRTCIVEASTDFQTWERLASRVIAKDGVVEVPDPGVANRPMRYYRVVASPP